jgi:hypothetical protein
MMAIGSPAFADSYGNDGINLFNDNNVSAAPLQAAGTNGAVLGVVAPGWWPGYYVAGPGYVTAPGYAVNYPVPAVNYPAPAVNYPAPASTVNAPSYATSDVAINAGVIGG